jgi:hypothetical protein
MLTIAIFACIGFAIGYFGGPVLVAIDKAADDAANAFMLSLSMSLLIQPYVLALLAQADAREGDHA